MAAKFLQSHRIGSERLWANIGAILVSLTLMGSLTLGTLSIVQVGQQTTIACRQVNVLRSAIVQVLRQSENDLPHNLYLKKHPAELQAALQAYATDIAKLQPVAC